MRRHLVDMTDDSKPSVVGLFAGVGGIETGFSRADYKTVLLCENDDAANAVLDERFPNVQRHDDVTTLRDLPPADVVTAGFPCQDLSQAGQTAGIRGKRSGLVEHIFELLDGADHEPAWVVLENVSFMLQLDRGRAMKYLTDEFGRRGYIWAYRIVDTRAFGLPQRRQRVLMVASRERDPRPALFGQDAGPVERSVEDAGACGFYWTEGLRGLGWAVDAVPPLKGGSSVGIPSPPGVWLPLTGEVGTPDLRDAERLQGFEPDWTAPAAQDGKRNGPRWKLIGNAVSVPVSQWLGERLMTAESWEAPDTPPHSGPWPKAAWGKEDRAYAVPVSLWPVHEPFVPLCDFLIHDLTPLSQRATSGFLERTRRAKLRFVPEFIEAIEAHLDRMSVAAAA